MEVKLPNSHVALICGGTAPIGARIALQLARAGAGTVVVAGRGESRGAAIIAELRRDAPTTSFHFVCADLRDQAGGPSIFEFIDTQCGGLDAYVHCVPPGAAGGLLENADLERFRLSLGVGLGALADMCRLAARMIKSRGGGQHLALFFRAG